jgi:hypothetical protein
MDIVPKSPPPRPTESEAIVAAERIPETPVALLVPPVPLPVDEAANAPVSAAPAGPNSAAHKSP